MQPFNPLFSEDEVEYLREALEAGEGRPSPARSSKPYSIGPVMSAGFLLESILTGHADVRRRADGRFVSKQPRQEPLLFDESELRSDDEEEGDAL